MLRQWIGTPIGNKNRAKAVQSVGYKVCRPSALQVACGDRQRHAQGRGATLLALAQQPDTETVTASEQLQRAGAPPLAASGRRVAIWALLAGVLVALRDFVGIVFGTFVLSYIGCSVTYAEDEVSRKRRVLAWFAFIVLLITLFGLLTVPAVTREGAELAVRLQSENPYSVLVTKLQSLLGEQLTSQIEKVISLVAASESPDTQGQQAESVLRGIASNGNVTTSSGGLVIKRALQSHASTAVSMLLRLISSATRVTLQACISLVFSFFIVYDLPVLRQGIETLRFSRLGPLYDELAEPLRNFGSLVGKSLQAQVTIAIVNTALTAVGMWILQLPSLLFLSLVVFLMSFIPLLGVIVSTIPMCLDALSTHGFGRAMAVIAMVAIVHAIEAYALNPAIYSAHLKLHPLLVLTVLLLSEHSVGLWGLILAVPFSVFVIEHVVKTQQQRLRGYGSTESMEHDTNR